MRGPNGGQRTPLMATAAILVAMSWSSLVHGKRSMSGSSIERWAADALLTVWSGKSYSDRSCFKADSSSVPCDGPGVAQIKEEVGLEYFVSVGDRTDVALDCWIQGGAGSPIPFSLPTRGASHTETIRVPSTAEQSFEVICEAPLDQVITSSGAAGRTRITVFRDIKAGKTIRRVTVIK